MELVHFARHRLDQVHEHAWQATFPTLGHLPAGCKAKSHGFVLFGSALLPGVVSALHAAEGAKALVHPACDPIYGSFPVERV